MKDPFKRFTIAVTGDFGERRGHDKMKQWIQLNGGKFAFEISPGVTHLICSKDHYKKGVATEQARALETVKVVSFDWLEDSLMKMVPLSERNYLMNARMKTTAVTKAKRKYIRKENVKNGMEKFERACIEFMQDMKTDGYEIYRHPYDGFPYDITLARANLLVNKNERYQLKLYVSHATPKMFVCSVKYSAPNTISTSEVLAPIGSSWETAWRAFELFFKLKTRKDWDMRFVKYDRGADAFVYTPPREDELRGMF